MANKYWINGNGNWSDTSHWSLSYNGDSGASYPTIGDNAYLPYQQSSVTTINIDMNIECNEIRLYYVEGFDKGYNIITNGYNITVNELILTGVDIDLDITNSTVSSGNIHLMLSSIISTNSIINIYTNGYLDGLVIYGEHLEFNIVNFIWSADSSYKHIHLESNETILFDKLISIIEPGQTLKILIYGTVICNECLLTGSIENNTILELEGKDDGTIS
jgi:hypothetical protein